MNLLLDLSAFVLAFGNHEGHAERRGCRAAGPVPIFRPEGALVCGVLLEAATNQGKETLTKTLKRIPCPSWAALENPQPR